MATRTRSKEGPPVVESKTAVVVREEGLPEPPQGVRPTPHVDIEVSAIQSAIVSAHLDTGAVNLTRADVVAKIGAANTCSTSNTQGLASSGQCSTRGGGDSQNFAGHAGAYSF